MNSQFKIIQSLIAVIFFLSACLASPPTSSLPSNTKIDTQPKFALPNLVVGYTNSVEVKRLGTSEFVMIGLGATLYPMDRLRTNGEVAIFCGDEAAWSSNPVWLSGEKETPCINNYSSFNDQLTTLRAPQKTDDNPINFDIIPYVITPNRGFVLDKQISLRWNVVVGSAIYTATLESNDDSEIRLITTTEANIAWPESWSPLKDDGENYVLRVQAQAQDGSVTEAKGQGFSVIETKKKKQLLAHTNALQEIKLDEPATSLLVAELYRHNEYRLYSDAANLLSTFTDRDEVSIYQLLGEIYLSMRVWREAERAFENALDLAQSKGWAENEPVLRAEKVIALCAQLKIVEAQEQWARIANSKQASIFVEEIASIKTSIEGFDSKCTAQE